MALVIIPLEWFSERRAIPTHAEIKRFRPGLRGAKAEGTDNALGRVDGPGERCQRG